MTIWAAYSNFEEKKRKSGKWADFVLFDKDIMKIEESEVLKMKPSEYLFKKHESQVNG
jgi:predicted amidohydrolase YtcJ